MKQTLENILLFWPWLALCVLVIEWISTPRADRAFWPKIGLISLALSLVYFVAFPLVGTIFEYLGGVVINTVRKCTGLRLHAVILWGVGGLIVTAALWEYFADDEKFPRFAHFKRRLRWWAEDIWWDICRRFRR